SRTPSWLAVVERLHQKPDTRPHLTDPAKQTEKALAKTRASTHAFAAGYAYAKAVFECVHARWGVNG
ncbi:MAG: hypothetical protein ACK5WH_13820, partial [Hyphomonadaceae bacterium]